MCKVCSLNMVSYFYAAGLIAAGLEGGRPSTASQQSSLPCILPKTCRRTYSLFGYEPYMPVW
jgi:hypothetical protein